MTDIAILRNSALDDGATSNRTSTVGEPAAVSNGSNSFVTGNWYASRSTDAAATWTHIEPATFFPPAAGGFCCDQLVVFDRSRGIWIWLLQYLEQGGTNIVRLATIKDVDFGSGIWSYWDFAPADLDPGWSDTWFDYPDAATSDENLFVSFNMFNGSWIRAVVMRFPLDEIAATGPLSVDHWSTTQNGSLRFTQGAADTMFWGSHNSVNELRVFAWKDGESSLSWHDYGIRTWATGIASSTPSGVDWLGRADPRITGACTDGDVATFMWTAGAGDSRPATYVRVVQVRDATKQVVAEPDLFSDNAAWAYPAAAVNSKGEIGISAFFGGGAAHPGHVVGALDPGAASWVARYSREGQHSPTVAKWGDYLTCKPIGGGDGSFVASGYTLEGGSQREDIVPRLVHFKLVT